MNEMNELIYLIEIDRKGKISIDVYGCIYFQMRCMLEIAALYFLLLSIASTYVVSVAGYKVSIEASATAYMLYRLT